MFRTADLIRIINKRKAAARRNLPIVGYIGWAGNGNLGDDAMFTVARGMLPGHILMPYGGPRREQALALLGLSGKQYFDSVILGGGTLISPSLFPAIVAVALGQGLRVWSLGTGAGSSGFEMAPDVSLDEWKELLPQIRPLGLRGLRSRAALSELGIAHGEVIGDLALSLAREGAEPAVKQFAINLVLPQRVGYDGAVELKALEAPIAALIQDGWQPVPVAIADSDITPLTALLSRVSTVAVPVRRAATAGEFFQWVAPCAFTIAVRLHAAVLSCCAGVPPLTLGYRDKCLDFMESMGLAEWNVPWQSITEAAVTDRLSELRSSAPALRGTILETAQGWKRRQREYIESTLRDLHKP